MLTAYTGHNKTGPFTTPDDIRNAIDQIIWIDMEQPTREEELFVEDLLKTSIPTRDEMIEIELSNRLYIEDNNLYATASIVTKAGELDPEIHAITFVVVEQRLITLRYSDPKPFKLFIKDFNRVPFSNGLQVFAALQETIVNRMADILEMAAHHIDDISVILFRRKDMASPKTNFDEILRNIGIHGDLVSKARESLVSINRLISFVSQSPNFKNETDKHTHFQMLLRDIQALNDHATFMNSKISFLLDATLGMVSIEQNTIIKIFSVAAVIFLPPTLVASIYGMNFHFMPELDWHFGYPMAIGLMILSAFVPYKFFKKKGWL